MELRNMRILLKAEAEYFAVIVAAGFAFGTVRTLLIAPRIGELSAVVVEIPLMLLASWIACKFVVGRYPQIKTTRSALAVGVFALVLLLIAEASLSIGLTGLSLSQHIALYRELPIQIGLLGQILFALLPFANAKASSGAALHASGNKGSQL
jgi:hypothetical protein